MSETENTPQTNTENEMEYLSRKLSGCPIRFEGDSKDGSGKVKKMIFDEDTNSEEGFKSVFGTTSVSIMDELVVKGVNALSTDPGAKQYNALAESLFDFGPRNAMEARLCTQAQALFSQGMKLISYANDENMIPQQSHCLKFAMQCLRLHNETVLALDKLRRGGEQKVTVQHQHFNVNDGGQAAIMAGNFRSGGGGNEKSKEQTS